MYDLIMFYLIFSMLMFVYDGENMIDAAKRPPKMPIHWQIILVILFSLLWPYYLYFIVKRNLRG